MTRELEPITFVSVVNDFSELKHNLLASPVAQSARHEWIIIDNTDNKSSSDICKLYVDAQNVAKNDLVFFFHQDVYLPSEWEHKLVEFLIRLERLDRNWGVLGAVGVAMEGPGFCGHWSDPHSPNPQYLGFLPCEVSSLDEMWLGLRKQRGLGFDPKLPGFHCYGLDLCLAAATVGLRSYAIDAFVAHKYKDREGQRIMRPEDSKKILARNTPEFLRAAETSQSYIGTKWRDRRPFRSTSMRWEALDLSFNARDSGGTKEWTVAQNRDATGS